MLGLLNLTRKGVLHIRGTINGYGPEKQWRHVLIEVGLAGCSVVKELINADICSMFEIQQDRLSLIGLESEE